MGAQYPCLQNNKFPSKRHHTLPRSCAAQTMQTSTTAKVAAAAAVAALDTKVYILHHSTLPNPTLPYPTLPYPTLPYPTLPYPTLPQSTPTSSAPPPPSPPLPLSHSTHLQHSPRDGDSLLLPTGELHSPLPHLRVKAVGELHDKIICVGKPRCFLYLKLRCGKGGGHGGGRTHLLLALSHVTIDHACLSRWSKRMGHSVRGVYSVRAWP